jgi:hypothetical protein
MQQSHAPGRISIMTDRSRRQALLYLALAILGLGILAAGLSDLKFEAGLPIPGSATQVLSEPVSPAGPVKNEASPLRLVQGVLGIGLVLLLFVFLVALFKKASIKRIGLSAAGLALLVLLLLLLPNITPSQPAGTPDALPTVAPPTQVYSVAPIGDPPSTLFWLVIAGLVLLAAGLGAWLLIMANRHSQKEDRLALEAEAAIQAIAAGDNIKNVIIRCYLQMEQAVKDDLGIERKEAVTPREFERHLIARGIPDAPVFQLTRLFETARYGQQVSDSQIEQDAIDCLSAIRSACQEGKGGKG